MSGTVNTINTPAAVDEYHDKRLLYRARQQLAYMKIAQERSIRMRQGKTIVFRRYEQPALATTPLSEGTPPAATFVDHTDITASILPYGAYIQHTDFFEYTIDNPAIQEYDDILGQQMGETMDSLLATEAVAGSNVVYGGNAANRAALDDVDNKITGPALDQIIRALSDNNARRFTAQINPGQNVSTYGVHKGFWAVVHPDVYFTCRVMSGWKEVIEYSSTATIVEGEVGAYRDIRFLMTTLAPVLLEGGGAKSTNDVKGVTNADVYQTVICGREAIATIPLEGASTKMITKKLGSSGAADPLDMIATQGWKHFGARKILNDDFIYRLETTAGLNAP